MKTKVMNWGLQHKMKEAISEELHHPANDNDGIFEGEITRNKTTTLILQEIQHTDEFMQSAWRWRFWFPKEVQQTFPLGALGCFQSFARHNHLCLAWSFLLGGGNLCLCNWCFFRIIFWQWFIVSRWSYELIHPKTRRIPHAISPSKPLRHIPRCWRNRSFGLFIYCRCCISWCSLALKKHTQFLLRACKFWHVLCTEQRWFLGRHTTTPQGSNNRTMIRALNLGSNHAVCELLPQVAECRENVVQSSAEVGLPCPCDCAPAGIGLALGGVEEPERVHKTGIVCLSQGTFVWFLIHFKQEWIQPLATKVLVKLRLQWGESVRCFVCSKTETTVLSICLSAMLDLNESVLQAWK